MAALGAGPAAHAGGVIGTVGAVPFDDAFDEEGRGPDRLLPPDDRLWRHPSEMSALTGAAETPHAPRAGRGRANLVVLGAALAGAAVAFGFLWTTRPVTDGEDEKAVVTSSSTAPSATPVAVFADGGRPTRDAASVVGISVARLEVRRGDTWTAATALWMDHRGTLLTAASVVEHADELAVIGVDGARQAASVLGVDEATTLAALSAERTDGEPFDLAPVPPEAGDPAATVGAGRGRGRAVVTVTFVRGTGQRATVDGSVVHDSIHLDGELPSDLSGGALVDVEGRLIAVVVGTADDIGGSIAVPSAVALDIAAQLDAAGEVRRPWLGVQAVDLDSSRSTLLGVTGGARLVEVTTGSPAADAGLATGDIVVAIGGHEVEDASDLVMALRSHQPGARVTITVRRGADEELLIATLGG